MKVNQILPDTRLKILKVLYQSAGAPLSGVKISEAAGISRVAVWKHIKALQQAGVDIEAQPTGYELQDPGNLLYPFCFPGICRSGFVIFQRLDPPWIRQGFGP